MPAPPRAAGGIKKSAYPRGYCVVMCVRLVCPSVRKFDFHLYIFWTHGNMIMKLITLTYYQIHVTLVTFSRSRVQRSRSHKRFPAEAYDRRFAVNFHLLSLLCWSSFDHSDDVYLPRPLQLALSTNSSYGGLLAPHPPDSLIRIPWLLIRFLTYCIIFFR